MEIWQASPMAAIGRERQLGQGQQCRPRLPASTVKQTGIRTESRARSRRTPRTVEGLYRVGRTCDASKQADQSQRALSTGVRTAAASECSDRNAAERDVAGTLGFLWWRCASRNRLAQGFDSASSRRRGRNNCDSRTRYEAATGGTVGEIAVPRRTRDQAGFSIERRTADLVTTNFLR